LSAGTLAAEPDGSVQTVQAHFPCPAPVDTREIHWSLPGHGSKLPTCGERRFRGHHADGEDHVDVFSADCGRFECPECVGYVRRAAHAIEDQLLRWIPIHQPAVHVVVSPPQDSKTDSVWTYRTLRSRAYTALFDRGFVKGCLVFHPVRIAKPGIRFKCDPGPHFHALGVGTKTNLATAYHRDGWVGKYLGSRRRIYRTAVYLLSHAGRADPLEPSGAAPALEGLTAFRRRSPLEVVTWFGYFRGDRCAAERPDGVFCPLCGIGIPLAQWYEMIWVGDGPPPEISGVVDPSQWRAYALDRTARFRGERISVDLASADPAPRDQKAHPAVFSRDAGSPWAT
jgi:hypothetical protein